MSRRRLLALGGAGGAAMAVGTAYSWGYAPYRVEYTSHDLPTAGLPSRWHHASVAHLTDLHVGPHVPDRYLRAVFEQVDAFAPDVVVITGDLTSSEPGVTDHARRVYADLPHGSLATLAVLGNHDYGPTWNDLDAANTLVDALTPLGIRVLRNESIEVDGLTFFGVEDLWSSTLDLARATRALTPGVPTLGLIHNPDALDQPGWGEASGWVLAGHTHGGQLRLPVLGGPLSPIRNHRYEAGEVTGTDGRRCYVSRGIGHGRVPARINCRPEVVLHRLVAM